MGMDAITTFATRLVWFTVIVLAVNIIGSAAQRLSIPEANAIRVVPYTVVLRTTGFPGHISRATRAVRENGDTADLAEDLGGSVQLRQRLIRMASGRVVITDEVRQLQTAGHDVDLRRLHRKPSSRCLANLLGVASEQERIIGEETISGINAVIIQDSSMTRWLTPELGCAEIRWRRGDQQAELEMIQPGAPIDDLFKVPSSFKLVSTDEMRRR